ncbi:hypothetical protein Agub_g14349, partial [Astrephomene gubernaculifera]
LEGRKQSHPVACLPERAEGGAAQQQQAAAGRGGGSNGSNGSSNGSNGSSGNSSCYRDRLLAAFAAAAAAAGRPLQTHGSSTPSPTCPSRHVFKPVAAVATAAAAAAEEEEEEAEEEEEGEAANAEERRARYRRCAAALSCGGLCGVRCAWGQLAEGAALAELLGPAVFPSPATRLHEVGMCVVEA